MKTSAEKSSTTSSATAVQAEQAKPFFAKANGGDFFAPAVQTKLNVGQAGDVYEQEADRMAATVVGVENAPKSASQPTTDGGANAQRKPLANTVTPFVQRKAEQKEEAVQTQTVQRKGKQEEEAVQKAEDEEAVQTQTVQRKGEQEEEVVQKAEEEEAVQTQTVQRKGKQEEEVIQKAEEEEAVQARFNGLARRNNTPSLESRLRTGAGRGSMLPDGIRAEMEQGFGADFGNVRIHTDAPAVGMNEELHAQAFAHGSDIYFNTGKYNPATTTGKTLLAHELTHTIQQGATRPSEPSEQEQQPNAGAAANELTRNAAPAAIPATDAATDGTAEAADAAADAAQEADPQNPEAATDEVTESGSATPRSPEDDPNFQAVVQNAAAVADHQQRHNPPQAEAASAQAAATVAGNEVMGAAQANQVEAMNEQEPAAFDAESFKARLMERITSMQLPENQEEAANFDENNNIEEVNQAANQDVSVVQQNAAAPIDAVSQAEPDTGAVAEREVTPLPSPDVGSTPGSISADSAMPSPRPDSEVSQPLQENMAQVDNAMAENEVTDDMLANSNEPSFTGALDQTNQARENTATAPGLLRAEEGGTLTSAQQSAEGQSNRQLQNMQADREGTLGMMTGQQNQTATQDSAERQRISSEIDAIYNRAKTDVEQLLENLETQVSEKFTAAATRAKEGFETYVDQKMSAYKSRRYGGLDGPFLWARDKFMGLPDEVNQFFVDGRQLYIDQMDRELTTISQFVAEQLTAAKNRIAEGRQEVADYVAALPESLQSIGREAVEAIQSQFDSLQDDVNSKQDELIDSLAQQYSEALQSVDARIEEMKAANRGLVDMALGAIMAVIEAIINIKNMLMNLLSAAMDAIRAIITDPIGFLSNLFGGIKLGFEQFGNNIMTHLTNGLITWLTGSLGPMGIQIPDNLFSLSGVFNLVAQILGLTWDYVRQKAVRLLGEPVVRALEIGFEVFQIIRRDGIAGLWEYIKQQFNDLVDTVIGSIREMVISQVIQAGIRWVLSLLNPASAFVKACMMIIDVVKFFIQRGSQIIELVNAFIEGVRAVASGSVGFVANAIENALARAVPVIIGFLASLLGISGLTQRVQALILRIRQRVDRAIDGILNRAASLGRRLLASMRRGDNANDPEKQRRIDAGFEYLKQQERQQDNNGDNKLTLEQANAAAQRTKAQHPVFSSLVAVVDGEDIAYEYTASPEQKSKTGSKVENADTVDAHLLDNSSADKKTDLTISEQRQGNQRVGYKAKLPNSTKTFDGIIVGDSENAYVKKRKEKGDFNEKYNELVPLTAEERRKKINAGGGEEHHDFKPEKVDFELIGDNTVRVSFKYSSEAKQGGASDFTNTFNISNASKREASLTAQGNNLALKVPGTRGSTDSAGELAKKDYGIDLNSAHVLADWFLGSGYKESTNLLLTSAEFNQKTMADAEKDIQRQIKDIMKANSNSIVTFNLTVNATFEALPDDKIIEVLNQKFSQMSDTEKIVALQEVRAVLQGNQDPRRCLKVQYAADLEVDGKGYSGDISAVTKNEDIWLSELFKK